MKFLQISITSVIILLCITSTCYSQMEIREYWQNNKRYLLCNDAPANNSFALDMATGNVIEKAEAKQMWQNAITSLGNLRSIPLEYYLDTFSVQRNTWCAWNNCAIPSTLRSPNVTISPDKDKTPGAVDAGTIKGFDDLLKRNQELVKKWKKEDKKKSVNRLYHNPVIRYDTSHRRVFLVSYSGIAWVSEDSLDNGAKQVLGEVPGLRLESVASPPYHRFIFLRYITVGVKDTRDDARTICRVFDTHTMQLLKLPNSDNMADPGFVFCPSGDYVLAVHQRVVAPWAGFGPCLINLREWKKEPGLQLRGIREHMRFYLHGKKLYLQTKEFSEPERLWVLDLSADEKTIFEYPKNKQ